MVGAFEVKGIGMLVALLVAAVMLLIPPTKAAAGTAEEVPLLQTLDALNRTESPLSNAGKWSRLNWAANAGADTAGGWKPSSAFPGISGAYWNPTTLNDVFGNAAMVTMPSSPTEAQNYGALWLNMPSPGAAKSGYQLRWKLDPEAPFYRVTLSRWSTGSEALLTSNGAVSIPAGSTIAISDTGGTVAAWKGTPNAVSPIASFNDSTYSSGYAGIEGAANGLLLTNFKAGVLVGKALSATPVLDDFARQEVPVANGKWTKTAWASAIGSSYNGSLGAPWHGYGGSGGLVGAYWNQATYSDGGIGSVVAATVGTGSTPAGQYVGLRLSMSSPGSSRSGYEVRFTGTGTVGTYKAELARWTSESRVVLASKENVSLPVDSTFFLSKSADSLAVWTGTGSSFMPLLFARDATFSSGYAGIEVNGGAGTYYNFRAGNIAIDAQAPETTITGGPTGAVAPSEVFFGFSSSELGSLLECSMDGGTYAACASPKSYPEVQYGPHTFRVRATDPAGNQDQSPAERSFNAVGPPTATTLPATNVKSTAATINATVNPNSLATTYQFEYGTSTAYGSKVPATPKSAGSGISAAEVSEPLSGLTPGTTYHRRIVATNAKGTTYGGDRTFITTAPPQATTGGASELTANEAKLSATVNPRGVPTNYYFEYGTTTAYGVKVPATPKALGSGYTVLGVSDIVSGLTEGTKYQYRVVAVSELGTAYGANRTFETSFLPDPTTEPALGVDATEAVLPGTIDPNGEATEVIYEYGTTPAYGTTIVAEEEATGDAEAMVEEGIVDLQPETTYHYRIVATSQAGTATTSSRSFTTAAKVGGADPVEVGRAFYGIQWGTPHTAKLEKDSEMVRCSGSKYLRVDLLNPDTQLNFPAIFKLAAERGVTILPHLGGSRPLYPVGPERDQFIKEVKEAVSTYGHGGSFWAANKTLTAHPVQWWEVWNEPNYAKEGPLVPPSDYGQFLAEVSRAIRGEDSQAKILAGSLLSVGDLNSIRHPVGSYIEQMGHPGAYDALALHPYAFKTKIKSAPIPDDSRPAGVEDVAERVLGNIREARGRFEYLQKQNPTLDYNKPIWLTEIGWPVVTASYGEGNTDKTDHDGDDSHYPVDVATQRDLINVTFNRIEQLAGEDELNVRRIIYYNLQDQIHPSWDRNTGLRGAYVGDPATGTARAEVRPSYRAFQNLSGFEGTCLGVPGIKFKSEKTRPRAQTSTFAFNPNGLPTEYWLKWDEGPSSEIYDKTTQVQSVGTVKEGDVDRQVEISNLDPKTTYHYRVVARNDAGDKTFLPPEGQPDFQFTTPPATSVGATVDRVLHGQPGWAFVSGWVKEGALDGPLPGLDGVYVNVNFVRNGQTIKTVHPVVNEGQYSTGWVGDLGKGPWEVRTVLPPQAGYDEAKSDYRPFTVRDGVQLIAKHSSMCMEVDSDSTASGAAVMHDNCRAPGPAQNQVFSMVPHGDGYLLLARHSGKCVAVSGANLADEAKLVQWDCAFANHFRFGEEWWGPSQYARYFARHSGKCIDVPGASKGRIQLQQETCNGTDHQLWHPEPVDSAPIPTNTSLTMDQELHGSPGFVSFHGHLQAGAYSMANRIVYVEFDNADTPGWEPSGGNLPVGIDGNNYYEIRDFGLNPGRWNVRARYPGTPEFGASYSATKSFTIKRGYLFKNRFSEQCMQLSGNSNQKGAAIIQWPCSAVPGNGQVMSYYPRGGGWYDIRVNGTNRCVDVAGVDPNDGANLQLWDCGGATQHNQHWRREPISGQAGWFALIPRHAQSKCASNYHWSRDNGTRIIQWGCVWAGNQQWDLQGVIEP
jgi:hypothetical protein